MAVGALKDDEVDFVKVTTANLLRAIVDKLLQCQDYKVKDMARRYEIEQQIKTVLEGKCYHKSTTMRDQRAVALFVAGHHGETLTFANLQYHLKMLLQYKYYSGV